MADTDGWVTGSDKGTGMRQSHNRRVGGVEERRREYVWAKAKVMAAAVFGGIAGITLVILALRISFGPRPISDVDGLRLALLLVLMLPPTWAIIAAEKRASKIRYVPPVAEQVAALPNGATLVRGAVPPGVRAGELLRPAAAGCAALEGDLLRAVGPEGKGG
jgi:hypothetical protein